MSNSFFILQRNVYRYGQYKKQDVDIMRENLLEKEKELKRRTKQLNEKKKHNDKYNRLMQKKSQTKLSTQQRKVEQTYALGENKVAQNMRHRRKVFNYYWDTRYEKDPQGDMEKRKFKETWTKNLTVV